MTTAVQQAIAQAQAAAQNIVPATANTNAPAPAMQGHTPSVADFANIAAVDTWLKIKEDGVKIGDDPQLHEKLVFEIDFSEINAFWSASGGNPVRYEKSSDRVLSESGKPWSEAIRDLSQYAGRNVRDFLSATLPLRVINDIKGKTGVTEAGTVVGYTLAYTGAQEFAKLQKHMLKNGWSVTEGLYEITIGAIQGKNTGNNTYGKIQFLDIKPVEFDE